MAAGAKMRVAAILAALVGDPVSALAIGAGQSPSMQRLPAMQHTPAMQRSRQLVMFTEEIATSVKVRRPAEACFDAYSQLERIPEWCTMLGQIKIVSPTRSEWSPRLPRGLARVLPDIEWTSDQRCNADDCTIEWQSISGIDNCGRAEFAPLAADSCNFTLTIKYSMPNLSLIHI